METFLSTPIGAILVNAWTFLFIFVCLSCLYYLTWSMFCFHQIYNTAERQFLQVVVVLVVIDAIMTVALVSSAVSLDGLDWFYAQWQIGLIVAAVCFIGIIILLIWLGSRKGNMR